MQRQGVKHKLMLMEGSPVKVLENEPAVLSPVRCDAPTCCTVSLLGHILATAPDAIFIVDGDGTIVIANAMAEKLFEYTADELLGNTIEMLVPVNFRSDHVAKRKTYMQSPVSRPLKNPLSLRAVRKSGREFPVEISLSPFDTEYGPLVTAIVRDVSEHVEAEQRLKRMADDLEFANHKLERLAELDPLTEVFNRRGFERVLRRESARARREGHSLVAAMIDLDDFKSVNEKKGHAVGDLVLKQVAERVKSSMRATDYLARIGGDEFMVLMPAASLTDGAQIVERIRRTVGMEPIVGDLSITVSCGVVSFCSTNARLEDLLILARPALKYSKQSGKNKVSIVDPPK